MLADEQKRSEDQMSSGERDILPNREDTDAEEPQEDYLERAREVS